MFNALPNGEDPSQVHIHTIAYGSDADVNLLQTISTDTNGKAFQVHKFVSYWIHYLNKSFYFRHQLRT